MPLSPYAVSRPAIEGHALSHARCFDLDVLALRCFDVFAPLQPAGHASAVVVAAFVEAALQNRRLPVHGDGHQTRDFTFVDTVTDVLTSAVLRRVTAAGPVNLAEHRPARPGDVRDSQADSRRLRQLFPVVRTVPLSRGFAATVGWFHSLAA